MKKHRLTTIIATAFALTAASGCGSGPTTEVIAAPTTAITHAEREVLVAADVSKSTEPIRARMVAHIFDLATGLDRRRDALKLFRFGRTVQEVFSGLPDDEDAFALLLADRIGKSQPGRGTDYARMLETLAAEASETTASEVVVVVFGDGRNDFSADPSNMKCYRAAAARLGANPRVRSVRFSGVAEGAREEIRSVLKPLGKRLRILTLDQDPMAP